MIKVNQKFNNFSAFKPQKTVNPEDVQLGIFYTNDMHGDINRLSKFKTAHDEFVKENKNISNLTIAAGDCLFGSDKQRNNLMIKLFNLMGLDALALGNHEFADGSKKLSENLKNANFKSVSANLKMDKKCSLQERLKDKKLVKSAVFMKNGHKFGVIGVSPFDSYINAVDKSVKPKNLENTIKSINSEVKYLEDKGINKIVLCSHVGYENDLKIAKETEGVDIIVGGHSHTLIDGVNKTNDAQNRKLNLLNSKRNEPVMITQLGAMNKKVGYLDVIFDKNGILHTDKISNNLYDLDNFTDSKPLNDLMQQELGEKITLAKVVGEYSPKNSFEERCYENPLANLVADSYLDFGKKYGAEIALFQAGSIRGGMKDSISNYDVKYAIAPFNKNLLLVDISEKDLVEILRASAGSILHQANDTQLIRCAGMDYSVITEKEFFANGGKNSITQINVQNHPIDVANPSEDKKIKAVVNEYLISMPCTQHVMKKYKDKAIKIGTEQQIFSDYLKNKKEVSAETTEERIHLSHKFEDSAEYKNACKDLKNVFLNSK